MSMAQKPPVAYAPRGVVRKQIALRLLPSERAAHESLVEKMGASSASVARQMYLLGLESHQRTEAISSASATA